MVIIQRVIVSVVLALVCSIWPGETGAATISPGQSIRRDIGPIGITTAVDQTYARVTVTVMLDGQIVGEQVLSPDFTEYPINAVVGRDSVRGVLRLRLLPTPQLSSVDADLVAVVSGGEVSVFSGSLTSWAFSEQVIYAEETFWLSPELMAVTVVRGSSRANVSVTLLAGTETIYTLSVNQASPVALIADSLILGDVRVASGARCTLTIPTSLQRGMLLLEAVFQSRNIPPTQFSAAIATWPL